MTIKVQFQRVCQVQVQRLLLVAGITVVVVVLCQFFISPYEEILVLSNGSNALHSIELTSSHNIHHEVISTSNSSNLGKDTEYKSEPKGDDEDYDFPLDDEEMVSEAENMNHGKNLTLDDRSSTMRHVRSADRSTITEKEMNMKPVIIEQVKKLNLTSTRDNDHKPITLATEWELGNHIGLGTQHKNVKQTVPDVLNVKSMVAGNTSVTKSRTKPMSITNMTALWLQSSSSTINSKKSHWSSSRDRELHHARLQFNNAPEKSNPLDLYASVFRNVSRFKRSYDLMESKLKVYIYNEGEKPIFHNPKTRGIYASEGWFMSLMKKNRQFVVRDPRKAHLFYLPFSSTMLRIAIAQQNYTSHTGDIYLKYYINIISKKYRFWNRTSGADHFLVACHDWAPKLTRNLGNCIRALCNSNIASGFKIGKDVSLPVTYIRTAQYPQKDIGGNSPLERPILAFFAGSMHGYLRPILLQHWNDRESDMIILGPMPRSIEGKTKYRELMKSSKYCICARGYEVHTPRLIESIFYECVPVIISDNYVPPFLEVLEWEAFSVFVLEEDIPNLRSILLSIPEEKYLAMQHRVKMVQQHFLWHKIPVKYDLFHMILHSVWYNRIFQLRPS